MKLFLVLHFFHNVDVVIFGLGMAKLVLLFSLGSLLAFYIVFSYPSCTIVCLLVCVLFDFWNYICVRLTVLFLSIVLLITSLLYFDK